jgi:ribosomal protein S19E (S16A)
MEPPTLSPSEKLTLKHLAEGELHPRELDWVALQRLKHLGLLEERPAGFKLTQAGRDALRRLVLRV